MTRTPPDQGREHPRAASDRLRILLAAALGTVLVSYGLLVPIAAGIVASGGRWTNLDGAFATAMPFWLAAHLIPLTVQGRPLSVLPLLAAAGIVAITAFAGRWALVRIGGRVRVDGGAVIAAIAAAHAAMAVLGSALLPPGAEVAVDPWAAMVGGGLVSGAGAAVGVLRACGGLESLPRLRRVPRWFWVGWRGGGVALAGLVATGSLVVLAALLVRASEVAAAYRALAPGVGAGLGLTLVTLGYLPNAVVAGVSWALGPGVAVGSARVTPFTAVPGPESTFPLLAALPPAVPRSAPLVLLAPVVVGVVTGLVIRRRAGAGHTDRMRAGGLAAVLAVAGAGGLAHLAGGRLAEGPFDPVRVPVEFVVPAALLWVGVPLFVTVVARRGALDRWYEDEEPSAADARRIPEPRRPRTVAELVALREQQKRAARSTEPEDAPGTQPPVL